MQPTLDHLVWATGASEADCDWFAASTRARPVPGGAHPGFGTRNHLVGLDGDRLYLEILHPDYDQALSGTLGESLDQLQQGGMFHWAVRWSDLDAVHDRALELGIGSTGPIPLSRQRPDGVLLEWKLLFLKDHEFGGLLPFFIDWGDSEHPAGALPSAGSLAAFSLVSPDDKGLSELCTGFGLDVAVEQGEPAIAVDLDVGGQRLELPMSKPVLGGFRL